MAGQLVACGRTCSLVDIIFSSPTSQWLSSCHSTNSMPIRRGVGLYVDVVWKWNYLVMWRIRETYNKQFPWFWNGIDGLSRMVLVTNLVACGECLSYMRNVTRDASGRFHVWLLDDEVTLYCGCSRLSSVLILEYTKNTCFRTNILTLTYIVSKDSLNTFSTFSSIWNYVFVL